MRWTALARTASRDSAPDAARYAGRDRGCLAALLAGQQPGHGLSTQIVARPARDWRQAAGTGRWVGRMIRLPAQRLCSACVTLELRIQSTNPLNSRKHWKAVWREGERQKVIVRTAFWLYKLKGGDPLPAPPVDVTLTRISSHHTPMDEEGCAASLKHVRDQVSRELGVPDDGRKDLISFIVKQERGPKHRVLVEIVPRNATQCATMLHDVTRRHATDRDASRCD